jgi:hypothetical protein
MAKVKELPTASLQMPDGTWMNVLLCKDVRQSIDTETWVAITGVARDAISKWLRNN